MKVNSNGFLNREEVVRHADWYLEYCKRIGPDLYYFSVVKNQRTRLGSNPSNLIVLF